MRLKYLRRSWQQFLLIALYAYFSAACLSPLVAGQEQEVAEKRGRVDWIFVLDTSASMRGAGGTSDIFDRVKTALETFINNTEEGDSVTLYTFDRDTMLRPTVLILDETDRRDLRNTIRGVSATGDRTHTGKAIRDALDRAQELSARGEAERRTPSIVLLTDGIEDVRGIPDPVSIPSNVKRIPISQPFIFYLSLGEEHDPQLDELIGGYDRGRVIRDPNAMRIQDIMKEIRGPVVAPAKPTPTPVHVNVRLEPINLDFGELKPGTQTRRETLKLSSDADVAVQLSLENQPPGISLAEPSGLIELKAGQVTSVNARLAVADEAADGPRTFILKADVRADLGKLPADAIIKAGRAEGRLVVKHVSFLRRLTWWLAVILIVSLVALIGYCAYIGTTPWGLYDEIVRRRLLEGELEVLRPRPAQSEQAFINLGGLNSRRAALSQFVPDGAARDDDAELETAYAKGVKSVRLRRTNGGVRVNGAEVSFADLYDGDMIELGDARLRFNWINHSRQDETENGLN